MMKIYLYLIPFVLCYYSGQCVLPQPYFPPQIVFSPDNGQTIIATDEINQRAYQSGIPIARIVEPSYVFEHIPYAPSGTPQSKYYVQLSINPFTNTCMYETYWKYCSVHFNIFPLHWLLNTSSFEIKNYMNFGYAMVHSKNSSVDEDYWYANITCQLDGREIVPCEEIYFKKNTQIPLRHTQVINLGFTVIQSMTNYKVISMGKPDETYFDSVPKNWYTTCRDLNLGLSYNPISTKISLNQSAEIHISLSSPPHLINGNDTVHVQWDTTQCIDCFILSPTEFTFNGENFQEKKLLTITRVKDAPLTSLFPIFYGGGFHDISPRAFPIYIE